MFQIKTVLQEYQGDYYFSQEKCEIIKKNSYKPL